MKLYELTEAYAELLSRLEDCETIQEESEILSAIDAVTDDIAAKGEAYARIMRNKMAEAAAFEAEIKRLQTRKKSAENTVSRLKEYILFAMGLVGATELNTSIGKWQVRDNPHRVEVFDERVIPEEFTEAQPRKIMKSKILKHFKETGEILDGCVIIQDQSAMFR